jgi:alkanesulfonate monooxygenase SsuD/methylene tetrahydromethanopterin reductase-like flavin-dependent oxidoreductase (luciferase family)
MTTEQRRFRFGVQVAGALPTAAGKCMVSSVEAPGFENLVMPDRVGPQFAIGPALAVVAETPSAWRIGTLVWQNNLRHFAFVTQETATSAILSSGRVEFEVGAGRSIREAYRLPGASLERHRAVYASLKRISWFSRV